MSEIKAGDLVVIVRAKYCCGRTNYIGKVSTVLEVNDVGVYCVQCKALFPGTRTAKIGDNSYIQCSRLKKIDPPAEPATTERAEEQTV